MVCIWKSQVVSVPSAQSKRTDPQVTRGSEKKGRSRLLWTLQRVGGFFSFCGRSMHGGDSDSKTGCHSTQDDGFQRYPVYVRACGIWDVLRETGKMTGRCINKRKMWIVWVYFYSPLLIGQDRKEKGSVYFLALVVPERDRNLELLRKRLATQIQITKQETTVSGR